MCLQSVFFFKKPLNFVIMSWCLRDGCPKVAAAGKLTVLWKTIQFSTEIDCIQLVANVHKESLSHAVLIQL